MHEEMPQVRPEGIAGFQLWVNLPAKLKMTTPRYQNILASEIPEIKRDDGTIIRVITGQMDHIDGPVSEIAADPFYADVSVPPHSSFTGAMDPEHAGFVYLFEGEASFAAGGSEGEVRVTSPKLVVLGDGDSINVVTSESPARFLWVSGKPLNEPIARYGPFVMNTREEIEQALLDLRRGNIV